MTKTRSLTIIIVVGFLASILCSTIFSFAESLTFTAYYPSPNAFYNNLNTTNLKVNQDAFVGGSLGVGTPIGDTESDIFVVKPADGATLLLYGGSDPADPNSNYANFVLASPGNAANPTDPYIWAMTHSAQAGSNHRLGYVYHGSGQTDVAGDPIFTNVLTLDTDGDVGVNTTDPQAALHVIGRRIRFEGVDEDSTLNLFLELGDSTNSNYWRINKPGRDAAAGAEDLIFQHVTDGTTFRTQMELERDGNLILNRGNLTVSNGNLMVGRTGTNPAGLFVRSSSLPTVLFEGTDANSPGSPVMHLREQNSNSYWSIAKRGSNWSYGGVPHHDYLAFSYTSDGGANWKEALSFDPNNNAILNRNVTVAGNARFDGDVTVSGSLTGRVMGGVELIYNPESTSCWGNRYRWGAASGSSCSGVTCSRGTARSISSGFCHTGENSAYCYAYLCIE